MSTQTATGSVPSSPQITAVWWRLPIVWMVIGGPALVVVASFATLALAILNPDPVITATSTDRAAVPAIQARNHAATPQR